MKPGQKEFWIANIKTFLRRWTEVPPENVMRGLCTWRPRENVQEPPTCGTIACAGGWLVWMPEFVEMGVVPDEGGAPWLPGLPTKGRGPYGRAVSDHLFGSRQMFASRLFCCFDKDHERMSDHDAVRLRFERRLAELEAA